MYSPYTLETIKGSVGKKESTDPFTDGLEIALNLQIISSFEGSNRNAGITWDRTTSANPQQSD
jgi:hypothetical protein